MLPTAAGHASTQPRASARRAALQRCSCAAAAPISDVRLAPALLPLLVGGAAAAVHGLSTAVARRSRSAPAPPPLPPLPVTLLQLPACCSERRSSEAAAGLAAASPIPADQDWRVEMRPSSVARLAAAPPPSRHSSGDPTLSCPCPHPSSTPSHTPAPFPPVATAADAGRARPCCCCCCGGCGCRCCCAACSDRRSRSCCRRSWLCSAPEGCRAPPGLLPPTCLPVWGVCIEASRACLAR